MANDKLTVLATIVVIYSYLLKLAACGVLTRVPRNDSASYTVSLLECNFDKDTCPSALVMIKDRMYLHWQRRVGPTPGEFTGPKHDLSGNGGYVFINSGASGLLNGYFAQFITKSVSIPKLHNRRYGYCLKFGYHMFGITTGILSVFFDNGKERKLIFRQSGEKAYYWLHASIPFRGTGEDIKIIFEAELSYGKTSDIALDEIKLLQHVKFGKCRTWPSTLIERSKNTVTYGHGPEDPDTCGRKHMELINSNVVKNISENVIGGNKAKRGKWPWMAMICQKNSNFNFCGGTLLGNRWIVTAAHCVFDMENIDDLHVRLGAYENKNNVESTSRNFAIEKVFIHPDYNREFWIDNDVAVLALKKPVEFNPYINSICLSNDNMVLKGKLCDVAGWGLLGRSSDGAKPAEVLMDGEIPIRDHEQCDIKVTKNMVCAGKDDGTITDTCNGDSGGPLMYRQQNGQWVLLGITSWGNAGGCGIAGRYGVYSNVPNLQKWVNGVIKYEPDDETLQFENHRCLLHPLDCNINNLQ